LGCEISVKRGIKLGAGQKFVQGDNSPFTEFKPTLLISNDMVRSKQKKLSLSKTELLSSLKI